jgi:hypothetical protein
MVLYARTAVQPVATGLVAGRLLVLDCQHDAHDVRKLASDPFDGARP